MAKRSLTEFGKEIKRRLIDMDERPGWLIEQVKAETGLYFDYSYLYKIETGQVSTPSIVSAIRKILWMGGAGKEVKIESWDSPQQSLPK